MVYVRITDLLRKTLRSIIVVWKFQESKVIKARCETSFERALTACYCVFKVITLFGNSALKNSMNCILSDFHVLCGNRLSADLYDETA